MKIENAVIYNPEREASRTVYSLAVQKEVTLLPP